MNLPPIRKFALLACLVTALSLPVLAQGPVVSVRVTSLDAAIADVVSVMKFMGTETSRDELIAKFKGPLSPEHIKSIDFSRPVGLILPSEGMMLGQQGLIAALPVVNAEIAMAQLRERFPDGAAEGLIQGFVVSEGQTIFVQPAEGYLLAGPNQALVSKATVGELISDDALPPGNIAVTAYLEPVAPLVQMGLAQVRFAIDQQNQAATDPAAGEEAPPAAPGMAELAELGPLAGVYFQSIEDFFNNASVLRFSLELSPTHGVVHEWVEPKAGSTLEEFAAAQSGGLPEIASKIKAGSFMTMVGQVTKTPRFVAAMEYYANSYMSAMAEMSSKMAKKAAEGDKDGDDPMQGMAPSLEFFQQFQGAFGELLPEILNCYRGDLAVAYDVSEGQGMSVDQLQGISQEEGCPQLLDRVAVAMSKISAGEGPSMMVMEKDALNVGGVSAWKIAVDPSSFAMPGQGLEAIETLYGKDGLTGYTAQAGDLIVSAMGPDAQERFKTLLGNTSKGKLSGSITAADFAPLTVGPGVFMRMDLGQMMAWVQAMVPEDKPEEFPSFEGIASEIIYGVGFDQGRVTAAISAPLELLKAFSEMESKEEPIDPESL